MKWSHSQARTFRQCPRRWYFQTIYKNARSTKEPRRREAWVLSQLQTLYAWRGSLVDKLLETYLVPALNSGRTVNNRLLVAEARRRFELQIAFGRAHRVREPGMSRARAGDSFAAYMEQEYGQGVSNEAIEQAWHDVERAIETLFRLDDLRALIRSARARVAGRTLQFDFAGARVVAVPDLLLFLDAAPVVIDWKVHTFGTSDARAQLATYALAIGNTKPHRDFPRGALDNADPTALQLLEAQLLTGEVRSYRVDEGDVARIEDEIARSVWAMRATLGDGAPPDPMDLPAARRGETCMRCPFRRLCWRSSDEDA